MNYNLSSQVRNCVWQTIIECKVDSLPVKPIAIASHYGIECREGDAKILNGASGLLRTVNDRLCMFIDATQPAQRQRFTILHELGHYRLGHLGNHPILRSYDNLRPDEEQAADKFAADLLMPACVIWALNLHSVKEIADLCNVSMQAAEIRAKRMEMLYQRNMFLSHPLERQVFQQFQNFIKKYNS